MNIRARFEEIWPVPKRIFWSESHGEYFPHDESKPHLVDQCIEWDARLETFTRCQESQAIYVSLIEEMVARIDSEGYGHAEWHHRAKQLLEQNK